MTSETYFRYAVRYEVLRGGGVYAELSPIDTPEISYVSSSALKMSMRGTFRYPEEDLNFVSDRLRIVAVINGTEYPCGTFVVTGVTESHSATDDAVELEAYSILYLAQRKKTESRLHLSAGTNYITAVSSLLIGAGITGIVSSATGLTLASDREDWEIGTPYITIINDLLDEINYNSAWVDLEGRVNLTPYAAPSAANIAHTYTAGEYSLITDTWKRTDDVYSKCNVFLCICGNPDLTPMSATAVNDDPNCRYSTVHIGRVLYVETVDNVPNQAALTARANNLLAKSLLSEETVEFETQFMPTHTAFETVALDNGRMSGIYAETEWRMPLDPRNAMVHKAKRVT